MYCSITIHRAVWRPRGQTVLRGADHDAGAVLVVLLQVGDYLSLLVVLWPFDIQFEGLVKVLKGISFSLSLKVHQLWIGNLIILRWSNIHMKEFRVVIDHLLKVANRLQKLLFISRVVLSSQSSAQIGAVILFPDVQWSSCVHNLIVFVLYGYGREVVFELPFAVSLRKRRLQRERLFDASRMIIALIVHNIYVRCLFSAHQQIDLILLLVVESRFLQIVPRLIVVVRLILRKVHKLGLALALVCVFEEAVCRMLIILICSFFGLFIQLWIGCDGFVVDDLVSVHLEDFNSLHLVFFNFPDLFRGLHIEISFQ